MELDDRLETKASPSPRTLIGLDWLNFLLADISQVLACDGCSGLDWRHIQRLPPRHLRHVTGNRGRCRIRHPPRPQPDVQLRRERGRRSTNGTARLFHLQPQYLLLCRGICDSNDSRLSLKSNPPTSATKSPGAQLTEKKEANRKASGCFFRITLWSFSSAAP